MPYLTSEREYVINHHKNLERSTRQDIHPIATLVRPIAPAYARFHIEIWEPSLCNWSHYGYARDEAERSRLLTSIRAFSHRGRATAIASSGARATYYRPMEDRLMTERAARAARVVAIRGEVARSQPFESRVRPAQTSISPAHRLSCACVDVEIDCMFQVRAPLLLTD